MYDYSVLVMSTIRSFQVRKLLPLHQRDRCGFRNDRIPPASSQAEVRPARPDNHRLLIFPLLQWWLPRLRALAINGKLCINTGKNDPRTSTVSDRVDVWSDPCMYVHMYMYMYPSLGFTVGFADVRCIPRDSEIELSRREGPRS